MTIKLKLSVMGLLIFGMMANAPLLHAAGELSSEVRDFFEKHRHGFENPENGGKPFYSVEDQAKVFQEKYTEYLNKHPKLIGPCKLVLNDRVETETINDKRAEVKDKLVAFKSGFNAKNDTEAGIFVVDLYMTNSTTHKPDDKDFNRKYHNYKEFKDLIRHDFQDTESRGNKVDKLTVSSVILEQDLEATVEDFKSWLMKDLKFDADNSEKFVTVNERVQPDIEASHAVEPLVLAQLFWRTVQVTCDKKPVEGTVRLHETTTVVGDTTELLPPTDLYKDGAKPQKKTKIQVKGN